MWGDPREIARRKAARKQASLPLEQRKAQLAHDWQRAKAEASKAKQAADKQRQKAAGGVMRNLKLEMKQLGLAPPRCSSLHWAMHRHLAASELCKD